MANDSNPSALYRNRHDGTFEDVGVLAGCAFSQDGKPQAGMGLAIGDYDHSGTLDIFKTNFAGDTSTLYSNAGGGFCDDRTFASGVGIHTRWLGWGVGFLDLDNDGWLDLFLTNGHVYPEVDQIAGEAGYKQRKVVYRNLGNGRFEDIAERLGPPITTPKAGRGTAFGDYDNDGDVDVVVNNVHDTPDLFRLESRNAHHWLLVKLVGTRSNKSAIGARLRLRDRRDRPGRRGERRRQLHLAERPARALRPGRRRACRPARGALAERARGALHGARGGPYPHARRRNAGRSHGRGDEKRCARGGCCSWPRFPESARTHRIGRPQQPALAQTLTEARSLIDSGNPKAAIAKLEAAEPRDDPRVRLLLGVAQYRDDQCLPAIERLEPLGQAFPDGSVERREVIQVLGLCRYLSGQLREAIPLLEKTREWARTTSS